MTWPSSWQKIYSGPANTNPSTPGGSVAAILYGADYCRVYYAADGKLAEVALTNGQWGFKWYVNCWIIKTKQVDE